MLSQLEVEGVFLADAVLARFRSRTDVRHPLNSVDRAAAIRINNVDLSLNPRIDRFLSLKQPHHHLDLRHVQLVVIVDIACAEGRPDTHHFHEHFMVNN